MGKTVIITLHADAKSLFNTDNYKPDPSQVKLSDSNGERPSTDVNWNNFQTDVYVGHYVIWEGACMHLDDKPAGYSVSIDNIVRKPEFFETKEKGFEGRNGIVTAKVQTVKPEYDIYSYQIHFSILYGCRSKCFVIDPKLKSNT